MVLWQVGIATSFPRQLVLELVPRQLVLELVTAAAID